MMVLGPVCGLALASFMLRLPQNIASSGRNIIYTRLCHERFTLRIDDMTVEFNACNFRLSTAVDHMFNSCYSVLVVN